MRNFFKPLTTPTETKCKSKTVIEVNSDRYNDDENYQKSINQKLKNYESKRNNTQ